MRLVGDTIAATPTSAGVKRESATKRPTKLTSWSDNTAVNDFARSRLPNWTPPIPITHEVDAIRALKKKWTKQTKELPAYDGYNTERPILIADLESFEIYRSPEGHEGRRFELISLHHLEIPLTKRLCFDGFLCVGDLRLFVRGLTVQDSSIEGYGDDESPEVVVFVRSEFASKDRDYDIWFRLQKPTKAYKKFHDPFMWIAQLAKHVLDYMEEQPSPVDLMAFRDDFYQWLVRRFGRDMHFQDWHQSFRNQKDFRVAVNAYSEYLYLQAFNLPGSKTLLKHPLWSECMTRGLAAIKKQPQLVESTLATPYVYESFKDMYFGSKIRPIQLADAVRKQQKRRKRELGFEVNGDPSRKHSSPACIPYGTAQIEVGDIVAFDPDDDDQGVWRDSNWEWLAYVQAVELLCRGVQRLFVLYLYRPRETHLFKAKYPFENELFFSDNCNCTEGQLLSTDVKGKYEIDWMPTTIKLTNFFVRQTYVTQDSAFVTFKEEHKVCFCKRKLTPLGVTSYQVGDTVYMKKTFAGQKILEPVVIRHLDTAAGVATIRRLLRLARDCTELAIEAKRVGHLAPNELVLTDDYETVSTSRIERRCRIRHVRKEEVLANHIPFPYNHGGAGDLWFVSMGIATNNGASRLMFLKRLPDTFNEGSDMNAAENLKRLIGLSLFSGGGNLDRGLEEGGAVEFRTAVDLDAEACHTQRACARDPSKLNVFYGSVDDYLKAALLGKDHALVARVGEVNLIAAGSPCPGFSVLQQNFLSDQSLRNASHISTLCSFVDVYRPEYAVLENVVSMASTRTGFEDQNVLSQVVACFVSMGYQVNQYIMDSWSYGSGQHRCRVFLTIAAPGLQPILQPPHTHSRPYEETTGRSLGWLPNGQKFGEREYYPTPFPYVTAGSISSDLPSIGNGNVQACIPFPDHRVSKAPSRRDRAIIACIPVDPPGYGYKEAFNLGLLPEAIQISAKKEMGKAFRRIKEVGLIPTITTGLNIQDARNGACVHWREHRPITILDARRAQGYPDEEPIIGDPVEQYRIVGNSVDRKVAFALGMSVQHSVQRNAEVEALIQPADEMIVDAKESLVHIGAVKDSRRAESVTIYKSPSCRSQSESSEANDVEASYIPMLDGSSDAREMYVDASEADSQTVPTPGMLSRMAKTISNGMASLALQSGPHLLGVPPASALQPKRGREDDLMSDHNDGSSDTDEAARRKRVKTKDILAVPETIKDTIVFKAESSNITQFGRGTRYTRHSGLEANFAPKRWDVRPERDYERRQ
ncbi:S-adenosyl-L-methionine-dependent methyltransferase [Paraphoma chrysanthemicola]|uniref:DNA (cytosine-5-)-methyltransferase n=1 Tax=Paraphoma chrysanthemicola TaxID=798071 RepID=A0A8K0R0D0_9PLEO|nr:S-adenosyl-L-methionine-dependent methyltransferase [Paraphoma chrysanthemicola]